MLTETDGPFVAVDGAPARPQHAARVVAGVAQIWGVDPTEAAERLHRNARRAFDVP